MLPVADGSVDKVLGVVKVREVLAALIAGKPIYLGRLMRKAEVVPDQLDAMDALRILQSRGSGMAMVHDEYGHLDGIVTPADLLNAMAGTFASHQDEGDEPDAGRARRWLAADIGRDVGRCAGRTARHRSARGPRIRHCGGLCPVHAQAPARRGRNFTDQGWRFEVVDMDGRKIDKLLVSEE